MKDVLRWMARIAAIFILGSWFLLLGGELLNPHSGPPSGWREWTGLALMTVSVLSLIPAWRWEFSGGLVSLVALAAFAAIVPFQEAMILVAMAVPGALFLADWLLRRQPAGVQP